jgi:hypothetical protein
VYAPCSGKTLFLAATLTVQLAQANAKTVPAAMIAISQ